jgi:membrane protein
VPFPKSAQGVLLRSPLELRYEKLHYFKARRFSGAQHLTGVTWTGLKRALASVYRSILRNRTFQIAAALSYYFALSVFPALILFFAAIASLPISPIYGHYFGLISSLFPAQAVSVVQAVLLDVLAANQRAWLSLGTVGTIWVVSSAFDAMIEGLDTAYRVKNPRPLWKTRLLAIGLAATTGFLLLCGMTVMILGPQFGAWLAARVYLPPYFPALWPVFHWVVAAGSALSAVELLYLLAPNVKQRFWATLPGAVATVLCWIGLSYLLGFYFRHIANFSHTYGTLAGFIAFMTWLYWNSFALLMGAEFNAALAEESASRKKSRMLDTLASAA